MEIGSYSPPGLPIVVTGIAVQGGIVLAAAGDAAGVMVLGVIDASSIQELSFILTPGEALKISRDLNHVVLADGAGGVRFWGQDLSGLLFSDGFESGDTGAWQ